MSKEKNSIVVDPNKSNSDNNSSQMDTILARMDQLESESKKDKETIEKLMKVADSSRLARLENTKIEGEAISLCLYDDKVVVGLKMLKDIVEKNLETKKYDEIQTYELTFQDGTTTEMPFVEFMRRKKSTEKILAKEISESKENGKKIKTYTVHYKDEDKKIDEIIKIDSKLINI